MQHNCEEWILKLSSQGIGAERLTRAGRTRQKHTTSRLKTLFLKLFAHACFNDDMCEFCLDRSRQNDIVQSCRGITCGKKLGQITFWRCNWDWHFRRRGRCVLPSFSPLAQLLGETFVSLLGFGRRQLHRQVVKTTGITFGVAFYKPDELLCRCHPKTSTPNEILAELPYCPYFTREFLNRPASCVANPCICCLYSSLATHAGSPAPIYHRI